MPGWLSSSPLSTPARSPRKPQRDDPMSAGDDDIPAQPLDDTQDEEVQEDIYDVEAIVDRKVDPRGRVTMYKIQWKGYPGADSWEPAENVEAPDLIEQYEARLARKAAKKAAKAKALPKLDRSSRTPSVLPSTSRSRSLGRHSSVTSIATVDSGHAISKSRRRNKDASFFYRDPLNDLRDLIIPMATAFCEESFSKIRKHFERRHETLFTLHPATLVLLRRPPKEANGEAKQRYRDAIKQIADEAEERRLAILSSAALPDTSIFQDTAVEVMLKGGEPFKLAWPFGLTDGQTEEYCHILNAIQHIQQSQAHYRCRLLVRKIKPHLLEAANYFNVSILDLASARVELNNAHRGV